jgi:hypothetical protein
MDKTEEKDQKDKKPPELKPEEKAVLTVKEVRKNNLGKQIFYVTLSDGKRLNTKDLQMAEKAQDLLKKGCKVAYKEGDADKAGHAWLVDIKAVA